jgi:antitoxin VapB
MIMANTAKVFWSGRSQAVRLPKEFRFEGKEVTVRREGRAVILEPIEDEWAWLDRIAGPLPKEFLDALDEYEGDQPDRALFD